MEGDAETRTVDAGKVAVGEAPDVVDAQDGEDIVDGKYVNCGKTVISGTRPGGGICRNGSHDWEMV